MKHSAQAEKVNVTASAEALENGEHVAASAENFLLKDVDDAPFEVINETGSSRVFLVCEHAGRAIPSALGDLGLSQEDRARHIAFDIGAEEVSRHLSSLLNAPLVIQPYSRLVIDCNRPFDADDSIPFVSDTTIVPANHGLNEDQRKARQQEIHDVFHGVVASQLDRHTEKHQTILVTVHSFTRRLLRDGVERPWELGLLFNRDDRFARRLMAAVNAHFPEVVAAFNEPYVADDFTDYAIPVHGEARGLENVLLEIRNDLIADEVGQKKWAALLAVAIKDAANEGEFEADVA